MLRRVGGGFLHAGHAGGYRYGGPTSTPNPIPSLTRARDPIPTPNREGRREDGKGRGRGRRGRRTVDPPTPMLGQKGFDGAGVGRESPQSPAPWESWWVNTWGLSAQDHVFAQTQDQQSQAPGQGHVEWGWEKRWARPTATGEEQKEEGRRHRRRRRRRRHRRRRRRLRRRLRRRRRQRR